MSSSRNMKIPDDHISQLENDNLQLRISRLKLFEVFVNDTLHYDNLEGQINEIQLKYKQLENEHEKLKNEHEKLKNEHEKLKTQLINIQLPVGNVSKKNVLPRKKINVYFFSI